jgi:hypothetical protein
MKPFLLMPFAKSSIWATIATFCQELAPVSGPLVDAIGQTARAIDRGYLRYRALEIKDEAVGGQDLPEWDDLG